MKTKFILGVLMSSAILFTAPGCKDEKEGCTDPNADNYDSKADINKNCRFRFASNIDISNVSATKPDGSTWDDGSGPDLKLNFGKVSSMGFDHSTNTAENAGSSATLVPNSDIMFTNEMWKFELVDEDLLGSETIASGTFNPLSSTSENIITIEAGGATFKFKYTIR